jgi:hypothetical protein
MTRQADLPAGKTFGVPCPSSQWVAGREYVCERRLLSRQPHVAHRYTRHAPDFEITVTWRGPLRPQERPV